MCFVKVDINTITEEKCKDPEFKRGYEIAMERYSGKNIGKKRYKTIDRVRRMRK